MLTKPEFLILSSRHSAEVDTDLAYVRKTLGVTPGKSGELTLTFGALPRGEKEIAVLSRSMLEILLEVSYGIDVPESHVSEGRTAAATRFADAQNLRDRPLIHVQSSASQPLQPFSAVRYRNTWYWIGDSDLASKRAFTFLMMFFSLAETGVAAQAPVLTLPAN